MPVSCRLMLSQLFGCLAVIARRFVYGPPIKWTTSTTHIKKSNQNGVLDQMRIQIRPRRRPCPDPEETRLDNDNNMKHKLTSERSVFGQRPHWDCGYKARTTASGGACRMTIRRLVA